MGFSTEEFYASHSVLRCDPACASLPVWCEATFAQAVEHPLVSVRSIMIHVTSLMLARRIRDAVSWCTPLIDPQAPSTCLRTLPQPTDSSPSWEAPWHARVERIVHERVTRLGASACTNVDTAFRPPDLAGGRIVTVNPYQYLHEQLEQDECGWYLDTDLIPPTDTWLLYTNESSADGLLLAWVPPAFQPCVHRAIDLNTTGCMRWLEDLQDPLGVWYRSLLST